MKLLFPSIVYLCVFQAMFLLSESYTLKPSVKGKAWRSNVTMVDRQQLKFCQHIGENGNPKCVHQSMTSESTVRLTLRSGQRAGNSCFNEKIINKFNHRNNKGHTLNAMTQKFCEKFPIINI